MFATARRSPLVVAGSLLVLFACGSFAASCPGVGATPLTDTAFDADRAWKDVEAQVGFGPRPAGSEALEKTRVYLESQLKAAGLSPVREAFKAGTPAGEIAFVNLYADLPAKSDDAAAPMVIIASHFDTKRADFPFVGANDGASSTGVLLELARVIAAGGKRAVAYRFLFLDGEEAVNWQWRDPDNRYGSLHHAAALKVSGEIKRVKAFVLMDMIGDKDLRVRTEEFSEPWLRDAFFAAAHANGLGQHVDGKREPAYDDHLSFLALGVPCVDLIDFDYDWWHTKDDTLDKCSKESLRAIGRIVLLGLPAVEQHVLGKR